MTKISCLLILVSGCFLLHSTLAVPHKAVREYPKAYLLDNDDFDEDAESNAMDSMMSARIQYEPTQKCMDCHVECIKAWIGKIMNPSIVRCCKNQCDMDVCKRPDAYWYKECLKG